MLLTKFFLGIFLSTLSLRRATWKPMQANILKKFLSTLSLRRATTNRRPIFFGQAISIHALLAESDYILCAVSVQVGGFLSTLSLRRATISEAPSSAPYAISIHALLAESDIQNAGACLNILISIHALLAESDAVTRVARTPTTVISIHALLAESDRLDAEY